MLSMSGGNAVQRCDMGKSAHIKRSQQAGKDASHCVHAVVLLHEHGLVHVVLAPQPKPSSQEFVKETQQEAHYAHQVHTPKQASESASPSNPVPPASETAAHPKPGPTSTEMRTAW